MPDEKPASPASVRRKDRAKDDVWIRELLQRAPFGVLATVSEGQPFVNSNLFVYAEAAHAIYVHTAHVGRTPANIECEERVCFSVSEMGRMLPAEHALKFSVEYAGVTVFGRARVLSDAEEKRYGLQLLLDKYFPHLRSGRDYRAITDDELARTAVYRIEIEHWSGKAKAERADFPGAFHYPVQPGE